ncbi:serine-rich adhesin for platelets [Eurosta solidaginis]|uniref:serine-rich adhesin for platelets n=1 Tax=Eurosta solidaginis TaxID=178769 RepID=UPI003530B09A
MSISKLRSRRGVLTRQEHVKSPCGVGENSSANANAGACATTSAGVGAGVTRASVLATVVAAENAGDACKTAIKQTAPAASAKLLNAAAINAAVVAAATVATVTAKHQQQQEHKQQQPQVTQTSLPQKPLLKIEPFVPCLTTRLRRRPFGRSYTTLNATTLKPTTSTTNKLQINKQAPATLNSPLLGAAIDSQLAKANAASTRAAVAARIRRSPVRALVKRQRSKSTSSSASNRRPATAHHRTLSPCVGGLDSEAAADSNCGGECASGTSSGSGNGNGCSNSTATANVTLQPNGICRIVRCAEEREKEPDRINYDRRGLSAIPIFQQETQLRLLSLQHNLINIFHIPKGEQVLPTSSPAPALESTTMKQQAYPLAVIAAAAEVSRCSSDMQSSEIVVREEPNALRQQNENIAVERIAGVSNEISAACSGSIITGVGLNVNAGVRLSLALSTRPARQLRNQSQAPLIPPTTAHAQLQPTLPHPTPSSPQIYQQLLQQRLGAAASTSSMKHLHYNAPLLPLTRQPIPSRFALKRSKSFLTNIPRHLQSIQQNMLKTQMARARLVAAAGGAETTRLKSFDSSASALTTNSTDSSSLTATTTNTYNSTKTLDSTGTTFVGSAYDEDTDADPLQQLAVKNSQLIASYGQIFEHLVFLDLYDNQIERIGNLDGLPALTVLLLGKNRISDLSGLVSLKQTLRVLDLHGNKITSISGKLNCLHELNSLNLAGNLLRQICTNDFNGLQQLRELNLKRNKIKRINGFQHLTALESLWLCHNELHRVDDMCSIAKATNLLEITIDNNPVSLAGDCVSFLVSYLPRLQMLTQMPITEQVRAAAMSWRRNKEISDTHYAHLTPDAYQSIKREEVISNARTNWELLRSQQLVSKQTAAAKQHQLQQSEAQTPHTVKQRELSRINESNETIGELTEACGRGQTVAELQDHIKLPAIQRTEDEPNNQARQIELQQAKRMPKSAQRKPLTKSIMLVKETESPQKQTVIDSNNNNKERFSSSPGSSLGPNVHSSSSCFSSDNEDSTELRLQQRGTRINKYQKTFSQQRPSEVGKVGRKKLRCKNNTTSNQRQADATNEGGAGTGAHKVNSVAETTSTLTTTEEFNCATTKQTTNDTNPTVSDTTVQPPFETSSVNAKSANVTTTNSADNTNCQALYNNSFILMPTRCTTANSSSTILAGSSAAKQITNQVSSSSSLLSLSSPTLQLPPQQQQTNSNNLSGTVSAISTISARTTCRRLMRLQTVQSAINNGSTTTATANSGSDTAASSGSRHAANNHNKIGTSLNGRGAGAQQPPPTVTCIVAPTPINAANNGNSSNSLLLDASQQRTTVPSKAEREAREREKEREREREQGGDYLIEICGRYLNVYGQGALRYIDKQWNTAKAHDVHTLNFSYINFNNIAATVLAHIKTRFPNAENFVFRETNIEYIGQLNALAELQGIGTLTIDTEGNAITTKDLWREYAIFRLSHWGLKLINGVAVTEAEIETANDMYEGLAELVLWAMPPTMLQPLLARLRLDETCTASKMSPKEWLMKPENKSLRLVVGKEALQWKKPPTTCTKNNNTNTNNSNGNGINSQHQQPIPFAMSAASACINANTNINDLSMRERGRLHFATMLENTLNAVEKLEMLETLWPSMLLDIVRNALLDYSHLDEYLRSVMEEIMK